MKKFFKALALVLALTLIVGVVPAQTADAKVKTKKVLYVGGAQGKSADEKTVSKISNKVAIYKLAGLTKAEKDDHKVTAELASKDNGVVKITKNYVAALKLGTAKVDVYVDGEKVTTTTIYSKVNATKDTLVLVDGEGNEIKDGQQFVIGGTYTFKLPRAGKDSDERKFYINGEVVADKADAARVYEHKFLKSEKGDVTFKFEAFQSEKLDYVLVSKEIKGKVVPPTPVSVKQTTSNAFTITFNQDIEEGDYYKDLKDWEVEDGIANDIYYTINDVKIPFSSVKATSRDKTDLTVTMFGNFVPGTKYFVDIAGETKEFVAAGNTGKDVTDLVILTKTAVVGSNEDIEFQLLNSLGVDITDTALADGTVTFEGTPSSAADFLDATGTVYFAAVGDNVKVKGTFTFYDPDKNYEPKTTVGEGAIVGVAQAEANFVSATYWVHNNKTTTLKMGEDNQTIYVKAKFNVAGKDKYVELGDAIYGDTLQVAVADEHYAVMTAANKISAVNQGTTSLILYCNTETGARRVIGVIPGFKVEAKRVPTTISAKVENVNTGSIYLNTADMATDDELKLTVTVKDQYGDETAAAPVSIELRTGVQNKFGVDDHLYATYTNASTHTDFLTNTDGQKIGFLKLWATKEAAGAGNAAASGAAVNAEDTLSYVVKANNLTTNVSFKINKFAGNSGTTLVAYASANSMEVALTTSNSSTNCADVTMHVNKMNGNYWTGHETLLLTDKAFSTKNKSTDYPQTTLANGTVTSCAVAVITRNGAKLEVNANGDALVTGAFGTTEVDGEGTVNGSALITQATNTIKFDTYVDANRDKLPAGNYVVSFYKVSGNDGTTLIGNKTLTITDNQVKPVAVQDKQSVTLISGTDDAVALQAVKDAYTFKWNGKALADTCVQSVSYKKGADGRIYVYSAKVRVGADLYENKNNAAVTQYDFIVNIGELLN